MIYVNVLLTVKNSADVSEIEGLLSQQGKLSRQEPGCLRFEVYHSTSNPLVFLIVERWENQAALDIHRTAQAYTTIYRPKVLPKVDRVPHVATLVE
jgi:quinol monooxygenase YgiN